MKLLHLRIACYLYNQFSDYDATYLKFLNKHKILDLKQTPHIKDLIEWLRSWGCRQFKIENEKMSIDSIDAWYKSNKLKLPTEKDCLVEYDLSKNKGLIIEIFNDLSERRASVRPGENGKINVSIGSVGAAKILFMLALRVRVWVN